MFKESNKRAHAFFQINPVLDVYLKFALSGFEKWQGVRN